MNNPFEQPKIQQESKAEREARRLKLRGNLLIILFCGVLLGFAGALYQAQVVNAANYRVNSNSNYTQPEQVSSVRGELLDRYGRVLVSNVMSYNVRLDTAAMGENRNEILANLLKLCREMGVEWTDTLPISATAPWTYTSASPFRSSSADEDGAVTISPTSLGLLSEKCKWIDSAKRTTLSAEDLLYAMCKTFGILDDGHDTLTTADRQLAGVLYELYLRSKDVTYNEYVFTRDVDITFISRVKEQGLSGVQIEMATTRQYETTYAAHVLGWVGAITRDTKEHYQELGYPLNATVGRDGAELAFEERLHGSGGTRLIEKDQNGNIVSQEWQTAPEPGENVELTLDIALQATVEDLLAHHASAQEEPGGMAAAVVDMTGGVLALASYPTYDLATVRENYAELSNDLDHRPLMNRATQGMYAPGSTFKMLTAVSALTEGIITTQETVNCTGIYTYYSDPYSQPHCWIWDSVRGTHGRDNVTKAITDSCNIFFYDVGRRTGIANLQKYAEKFGLGQYTGIEIAENKGVMAGPETSERLGQTWYDGNTMSVAIGQENNQFTPLQLANYVATLVNGGNHYQVHLFKDSKSSDYSEVISEYEPVLLDTIDIEPSDLSAVLQGMYNLSKTATMSRYFSSLPVSVGCKTGTAEVASKTANAIFVCFAPYEDPQVALCLVSEQGASGGNLADLAAGILAEYFSSSNSLGRVYGENVMLR